MKVRGQTTKNLAKYMQSITKVNKVVGFLSCKEQKKVWETNATKTCENNKENTW